MSIYVAKVLLVGIFAVMGVFSIAAGLTGWQWFFKSINSRVLTGKMRRGHARIFYVVIGIFILAMAINLYIHPIVPPCKP
jgi:hypothetical protein